MNKVSTTLKSGPLCREKEKSSLGRRLERKGEIYRVMRNLLCVRKDVRSDRTKSYEGGR